MPKWWKQKDPNAQVEEAKYDNPIPSRALITECIKAKGIAVSIESLCKEFELVDEDQQEALRRRLIAMTKDAQLVRTDKKFEILDETNLLKGTVQITRQGYGFVSVKGKSTDYVLNPYQTKNLMDGDTIMVHETGKEIKGKKTCIVAEVIERNISQLIGYYFEEDGTGFIRAENKTLPQKVLVELGSLVPKPNQLVLLDITHYPSKNQAITGIIRDILGNPSDPGIEVTVAVNTFGIPHTWPDELLKIIKKIPTKVAEKDKKNRFDLRNLCFVTIDGEDAKDFDDAVYCEINQNIGWKLYVAIADVSHYVKSGSLLDTEAEKRGTSVYFPDHVIPMLPEKLSNGLCSLNPNVDRLVMICEMDINLNGEIDHFYFYEGLIKSHARLTYDEVSIILEQKNCKQFKALCEQHSTTLPHLHNLYALYHVLKAQRIKRGAIDFDTTETKIIFNKNRKIKKIIPVERNNAHRLIEECMLCANVSTARFFEIHKLPALFRIHDVPNDQKLETLNKFLGERGLGIALKEKPTPQDYQKLLNQIKNRSDFLTIQTMVLRSLSQASYHPENIGHFGLAYEHYTHFTSPIRRYPDLLIHRGIRHVIRSTMSSKHIKRIQSASTLDKETIFPYNTQKMEALGIHCSSVERRADDGTRLAVDWLKCDYMQKHIGCKYHGTVVAVTKFGLFIELTEVFVTGFIHISALSGDYYIFSPEKQRLIGERTRKVFQLGDEIEIRVIRVDMNERNIDFEPVENKVKPLKYGKKVKVKLDLPPKLNMSKKRSKADGKPTKKLSKSRKKTQKNALSKKQKCSDAGNANTKKKETKKTPRKRKASKIKMS